MKKKLLSGFLLLFFFINCNEKKKETPAEPVKPVTKKLLSEYQTTPKDTVISWAEHYKSILCNNPKNGIQQINTDAPTLKGLITNNNIEGIKFIFAADPTTNQNNIFMQVWQNKEFSYYNINQFFDTSQRGMRKQPILCPPPDGCSLPGGVSENNTITQDEAQKMADLYNEKVGTECKIAVRQITMDAKVLADSVLRKVIGFKLINAYNTGKNDVTVILQLWDGDQNYYYYDINKFFNSNQSGMRGQPPLCPPPAGCDSEILVPTQKK